MNIASLRYLETSELYNWIKNGRTLGKDEPFQVIDVRGSDYKGGHIVGSWNYPYKRLKNDIDYLKELKQHIIAIHNEKTVHCVFHCAQSQERGPKSALMFLRSLSIEEANKVEVWVLRGGFNYWQSIYGTDSSVTEDYVPYMWEW